MNRNPKRDGVTIWISDKVKAKLVVLCFALLRFTDVAFFTS